MALNDLARLQYRILVLLFVLALVQHASAEEKLHAAGRDSAYVAKILERAEKNIASAHLTGDTAIAVRNLVANRYFELNDIYAERDSLKDQQLCDSRLYRSHFALAANLGKYLSHDQIIAIMDAMTYNKVKVTYDAYCDMIPRLTTEEKHQIYAWLCEARDLAIDAESSNKKHEVFNKYKGRINNYLSARGYNITEERKAWEERVKARGGTL